jgi:hypothetical protein
MKVGSRWQLISLSYVVAAAAFFIAHPFSELAQGEFFLSVPVPMISVALTATLTWVTTAIVVAFRLGQKAWPILIGAPFALALPIEISLVWFACAVGHECI